jgi:hypothetical protein
MRRLQPGMPTTESSHGLGLHARHAQQVLRVGQVGRELSQLRLELGLETRMDISACHLDFGSQPRESFQGGRESVD